MNMLLIVSEVGCCGTCLDARGLEEQQLVDGALRSSMEQSPTGPSKLTVSSPPDDSTGAPMSATQHPGHISRHGPPPGNVPPPPLRITAGALAAALVSSGPRRPRSTTGSDSSRNRTFPC